jgi:hypothetical protein
MKSPLPQTPYHSFKPKVFYEDAWVNPIIRAAVHGLARATTKAVGSLHVEHLRAAGCIAGV